MRVLLTSIILLSLLDTVSLRVTAASPPPLKRLDGQTLVFVADGVGGGTTVANNLFDAMRREGAPFLVQSARWSRYHDRVRDYADQEGQQAGADYIARWVQVLSKECPHSKLILVGYSAGTNVVLSAAAQCPPRSLHRIVLLAPAVSYTYDLRPAMKASCRGIDSFFSGWDGVLEMAEQRMGTADGQWTSTAGRVGFRLCVGGAQLSASDALRQHLWREDMGGHGGHLSWTTTTFTSRMLVPLLLSD